MRFFGLGSWGFDASNFMVFYFIKFGLRDWMGWVKWLKYGILDISYFRHFT